MGSGGRDGEDSAAGSDDAEGAGPGEGSREDGGEAAVSALAHGGVWGIHEAAAILDDKDFAAEAQQIRQRFQQHIGFGNQVLHFNLAIV